MAGRYDDDEDQEEGKKELVAPKYILLFEDMEIELKQELSPEEKDELQKEEEEKVQVILDRHTKPSLSGDRTAIGVPKYVWSKKMICECGSTFNRRKDHVTSKGKTYAYGCYNRKTHPKGGNYEYGYKYCEVKEVQEWKLEKIILH